MWAPVPNFVGRPSTVLICHLFIEIPPTSYGPGPTPAPAPQPNESRPHDGPCPIGVGSLEPELCPTFTEAPGELYTLIVAR